MHRISDGGACRRLGLGTMRALTTALAFAVLAACGGRHDEREELHQSPAELDTRAAAAPDDLLRIDPEMLRDLRVTTSVVESRPGGEGVTVLGEVGVNEDKYAEVGSPIAARVQEVLAGIGDGIGSGQPLAVLERVELGKARAGG